MNDYRVTLKVRNNRILSTIEEAGGSLGGKWCEENGLSYGGVLALVNMTICPVDREGRLRQAAQGLCDVLCKLPEDLWSEDQMFQFLEKNEASFEVSKDAVVALLATDQTKAIDFDTAPIDSAELKRGLDAAMELLTPKERKVLALRYEQDLTLREVGEVMDRSVERIRQIESKALRKLRQPDIACHYYQSVDGLSTAQQARYLHEDRKWRASKAAKEVA